MEFTNKQYKIYKNICCLTSSGVLKMMNNFLKTKYSTVISTPAYIVAVGDIPVGLVAHADTVFTTPPTSDSFFYDREKNVCWSFDGAGADDRAGIYSIIYLLKTTNLRPHIIITTGEEKGCVGAGKLVGTIRDFPGDLDFLIQLDRRGQNDSVFYDLLNDDFEDFINKFGFHTEWGTFTDITVLAPAWGVAAVNLSIGYIGEHRETEHLYVGWMYDTIDKVKDILEEVKVNPQKFEWAEDPANYWNMYGTPYYGGGWDFEDFSYIPSKDGTSQFNFDDGTKIWNTVSKGHNSKQCCVCGLNAAEDSFLPIKFNLNESHSYPLCVNCFGKLSHDVYWCKECGVGYFLSDQEKKMVTDRNEWVCPACEKQNKYKNIPGYPVKEEKK